MKNPLIKPIEAAVHGIAKYRGLFSVGDLAECLLYRFPEGGRGPAHEAARRACLAALEGKVSPAEARAAFVKAAEEMGITVRDG